MTHRSIVLLGVGCCAVLAGTARAIVIGTLDTFQDGTTMSWRGALPENRPDGGPAGTGDAYLHLTSSGGAGPSSHMATDNIDPRWAGDYLGAGVTALEADFQNQGTVTLEMRVVLFHTQSVRFTSTVSRLLPADGLWHHLIFPIDSASLTEVLGSETYTQCLTQADRLMFRHDPGAASANGTAIATQLGIDNVYAAPAPAGAGLLGLAALGLLRRRSRVAM